VKLSPSPWHRDDTTLLVVVVAAATLGVSGISFASGGISPGLELLGIIFPVLTTIWVRARVRRVRLEPKRKRNRPPRPPLHLLNATVKALWSAKTYERVFKPVIADIHREWADARCRHERFRAWWIRNVRGRYALLDVARHQLPWSAWSAIKRLVQLMITFSK
jgi:hypothetical protein